MSTSKFITYYRVSTIRQGASGLGLEAQRHAVARHADRGQVIEEFVEIESGKRHENRPQLLAALAACRKHKATLVIASLDRLARNVAFIATLMESGIEFIAADMPQATRLTIHVLAAVAEHEREMISKRTKVALAEAKRRGVKLGGGAKHIEEARQMALAAIAARRPDPEVMQLVRDWRAAGKTYQAIAGNLNRLKIKTTCGGREWWPTSVRNLLRTTVTSATS